MVRLIAILSLLLCSSPLLVLAEQLPEIELSLNADAYYPGDLIELSAVLDGAQYTIFSLQIPEHPKLRFLAYTPEPIRYQNNTYVQRAVWHFQPVAAGEFVLEPIQASLNVGADRMETVTLPPVTIRVQSYGSADASDALEALPPATSGLLAEPSHVLLFLALAVVLVIAVICLIRRKEHPVSDVSVESRMGLAELARQLEQDQAALGLIEEILVSPDVSLSAELRAGLEAAVYAGRMDRDYLLTLIRSGGEVG